MASVTTMLEQTLQSPARASSLPPGVFTNDAYFRWEMRHLFEQSQVCVGRENQFPQPGDYRCTQIADVPVIIVRDRNQILRVLSNTCRHRAAPVANSEGNCRRFQCPFHGWTYDLDGRLVGAPMMDRTDNFDRLENGLVELPHEIVDGFILVNAGANAPGASTTMGNFSEIHQPWNFADMVVTRRKGFEVACNWKLFIQVFMEYYHLGQVHRTSLNHYLPPEQEISGSGDFVSFFGLAEGDGVVLKGSAASVFPTIATLNSHEADGSRYTHMFPSLALSATRECMWFYECVPISASRSIFWMNSCFPAATVALADFSDTVVNYYERWDTALAEDIAILEAQQKGMQSPLSRPGRYSWMESGVAHFERWLARRIIEDPDAIAALESSAGTPRDTIHADRAL